MWILPTNNFSYNKRGTETLFFQFLKQNDIALKHFQERKRQRLVFILSTCSCQSASWLLFFFLCSWPILLQYKAAVISAPHSIRCFILFCDECSSYQSLLYNRTNGVSCIDSVQQLWATGTTPILTPISRWLLRPGLWLNTDLVEGK